MKQFTTIDDYLEELNSQAFRAGVEAALAHTQETGYETSFGVTYDPDFGFVYPSDISVGNEKNTDSTPRREEREKLIQGSFGKKFKDLTTNEMIQFMQECKKRVETLSNISFPSSNFHDYIDWVNNLFNVDYEGIEDHFYNYEDYPESLKKSDKHIERYIDNPLIFFHTHPGGSFSPSPGDLKCLDWDRRKLISRGHNPVYAIGINADKKSVFLIQEKTSQLLNDDFDYESCSKALTLAMNTRIGAPNEEALGFLSILLRFEDIAGKIDEKYVGQAQTLSEALDQTAENYSVLSGHYTSEGFNF